MNNEFITLNDFVPFLQLWIGTCLILFYQVLQKRVLFHKSRISSIGKLTSIIEAKCNDLLYSIKGINMNSYPHVDYLAYYFIRYKRIIIISFVYGLFILLCTGFEQHNVLYLVLSISNSFVILYILICIFRFDLIKNRCATFIFFLLTVICIALILLLYFKHKINITLFETSYVTLYTVFACVFCVISVFLISLNDYLVINNQKRKIDNLSKLVNSLLENKLQINDIPRCYRKKVIKAISNNLSINRRSYIDILCQIISNEYKKIFNSRNSYLLQEDVDTEEVFSNAQIQQIKMILDEYFSDIQHDRDNKNLNP